MTDRSRWGLGPLGLRLWVAFVAVALSSVAVLTAAALIGTSRGFTAAEEAGRAEAATATAGAAGSAYRAAGGWDGADLTGAQAVAQTAGARLVVVAADGQALTLPGMGSGAMGGTGMPAGASSRGGRGQVTQAVVVDGQTVGAVRLMFGGPVGMSARTIAWTWIIVAAVVALAVATGVAWLVTRRLTDPLVQMAHVAHAFAAGDRSVRVDERARAAPGELGDLARSFDATADAVTESERARQAMAADLAHELRTPLAVLQAGLEELADGYAQPDREILMALHAQSVRLGRLVRDVGQLAQADGPGLTLDLRPLDLAAVVTEAVAAARPALEGAGLAVDVRAEPVQVSADADRIHQCVDNLLVNAERHCRRGDRVTVSVRRVGEFGEVEVSDTGPGISEDDLPHVFDRLWRGTADSRGSGIGLAMVRQIVEGHGGAVRAESREGEGTTVAFALPAVSQR